MLSEFVRQIISIRKKVREKPLLPPQLPEPTTPDSIKRFPLYWQEPTQKIKNKLTTPKITKEEGWERLTKEMKDYINTSFPGYALLISLAPALGKSYSAIEVAQFCASRGQQVLYAMPRHDYWGDIVGSPNFDRQHWYHWQSTDGVEEKTGEDMCRYSEEVKAWTGKGHRMMDACVSLCMSDNHFFKCPYRLQAKRPERIIAGVHNHPFTGLTREDPFDLVIIDELPTGAIINTRLIRGRELDVGGAFQVAELIDRLQELVVEQPEGEFLMGKPLLDQIGNFLGRIYDNIENDDASWIPEPTKLVRPEDAKTARVNYLYDLLRLLIPEYEVWSKGWQDWLSRVAIDGRGLHILHREELWEETPEHIIILDATGDELGYELLLHRPVKRLHLNVENKGRIFQITHRYNGKSTIIEKNGNSVNVLDQGRELLSLLKIIRYSKPLADGRFGKYENMSAVTFKDLAPFVAAELGDDAVMWFGGNRGSNKFVNAKTDYDCLVVMGTPGPSDEDLRNIFSQLHFSPDDPVGDYTRLVPPSGNRSHRLVEYNFIEDNLSPVRELSGFWDDPSFQELYQSYTSAELRQAVGRARAKIRDVDVWLLSSVPIDEIMDGIWDRPGEALNIPTDIPWTKWTKIVEFIYSQEIISSSDFAESMSVTPQTARRWMKRIELWNPADWIIKKVPGYRGKVLVRLNESSRNSNEVITQTVSGLPG